MRWRDGRPHLQSFPWQRLTDPRSPRLRNPTMLRRGERCGPSLSHWVNFGRRSAWAVRRRLTAGDTSGADIDSRPIQGRRWPRRANVTSSTRGRGKYDKSVEVAFDRTGSGPKSRPISGRARFRPRCEQRNRFNEPWNTYFLRYYCDYGLLFARGSGRILDTFFRDLSFRCEVATVQTSGRFIMNVRPNQPLGRHIYLTGAFDRSIVEVLLTLAKPADVLLDVGANIGYISACFLQNVDGSSVISIEPQPK